MLNTLFLLLADEAGSATEGAQGSPIYSYVGFAVILVAFIVFMVFSSRNSKKREEETKAMLSAIRPGNKVKTVGGVCGIVKEVNTEDNTFVLETGSEESGRCCIKFDLQAVLQTDAKVPGKEDKAVAETSEVKEEAVEEPKDNE